MARFPSMNHLSAAADRRRFESVANTISLESEYMKYMKYGGQAGLKV